jgi:hypothetical protein
VKIVEKTGPPAPTAEEPAPDPFPNGSRPETRACFARLQARLKRQGVWQPLDDVVLTHVASSCAHYLNLLRESRATPDPLVRVLLGSIAKQQHEFARELLAQYAVIDRAHVHLAVVNRDGADALIAALCAPLDPHVWI